MKPFQLARTRHRAPVLVACLLLAPSAWAADSCLVSANPMAFGVYTTTDAAPTDSASQITVDCQGNKFVPVTIELSAGNGSYAQRRMSSTLDNLNYNLYLDASRSLVFGDGSGSTWTATCTTGVTAGFCVGSNPTGTYRRAQLPFFGRIPAQQNVAPGNYSDSIQVTVIF